MPNDKDLAAYLRGMEKLARERGFPNLADHYAMFAKWPEEWRWGVAAMMAEERNAR